MPQSELSLSRINRLLGRPLSAERLSEVLFDSKVEVEGSDGDRLTVTVTPDRLDLLSEGGLALLLQGLLGEAKGEPSSPPAPPSTHGPGEIHVDPAVAPVRGAIAGLLVFPPNGGIDADLLEEAIRFQELLHATVGRDRRRASLGLYAVNRMRLPLRYGLEPIASLTFDPLGGGGPVAGEKFFAEHPMALRYGTLGRQGDHALVLQDARHELLSLPPVLNGNGAGATRAGDGPLLLESTGVVERAVREALGLWSVVFAARGYPITPVSVHRGSQVTEGVEMFPHRRVLVPSSLVTEVLGGDVSSAEGADWAERSRLASRIVAGGWEVGVPSWRPDVLGPVDAVEEFVLARGLSRIDPLVPPSATRGHLLPMTTFRRRLALVLLGAGFTPLFNPVLVSTAAVERLGRGEESVAIANPPSSEYGFLRSSLQVSLLESLRRNTRHGYPQLLSEVGPVVRVDPKEETGARTSYHAGLVIARDRAGFADAAALTDYLLRTLDVLGLRESASVPGTIAGRSARLQVAGEAIAEIGEVHPSVLEALKLPVAVAWAEVDLSALQPLLGPPKTV